MAVVMMECGRTANSMAKDITSVHQWSIKGNGKRISCTDMARLCGKMAGCTRDTIIMAKRRARGRIHTPMVGSMLGIGCRDPSMDMVKSTTLMVKSSVGDGLTVSRIILWLPVDHFVSPNFLFIFLSTFGFFIFHIFF
jgi:hypothetical protein